MGGAEPLAPPIFFLEEDSRICRSHCWQKSCIISCKSRIVTETSYEKTLPYRALVRHSSAFHPARDLLRSQCFRNGRSRGCFTGQKEKQSPEQKTKGFEGPAQQTQPKTRLAEHFSPGNAILLNGVLQPARRSGEIGVPGPKTKTGNLAAPRFSAFFSPSRRFLAPLAARTACAV